MNTTIARLGRRLRLGVVGGGPGSFIGPVHRTAARLDDHYEVVAAVLSRNPERSRRAAREIGIAAERAYGDHGELLAREAARDDGIDVLAVMTPNAQHHAVARDALAAGLDVICDKPLTTTLEDALDLVRRVRESGLVFCLTHNYTGYPMVRHARAMVQDGALGAIRQLHVEYIQGHLAGADRGRPRPFRQLALRRRRRAAPSLVLGDIGTHAHHLACFITGLELAAVAAEVGSAVPGRPVADFAHLLLRFAGGRAARCGSPTRPPAPSTGCTSGCSATRAGWSGSRRSRTTCSTGRKTASRR